MSQETLERNVSRSQRDVTARRPKRSRPVDDQEMHEAIVRLIIDLGRRAGVSDASVLKDLLSLKKTIDQVAARAARELHQGGPGRPPLEWGVIASELGVTRQAAWQKWGRTR